MKIIQTERAPNPRRVRIFLAEKGIEVPFEERSLMDNELKSGDFTSLNPLQRVPILVLDDGTVVSETIAICRYFEAQQKAPALFGETPLEEATIEMWQRRIELNLFYHVTQVFRHLNPKMAHLEVPQVPAWGEANKAKVDEMLAILDGQLALSAYVAGADYSVADITTLVTIDFMKPARIEVPDRHQNIARWYGEVSSRPSAEA